VLRILCSGRFGTKSRASIDLDAGTYIAECEADSAQFRDTPTRAPYGPVACQRRPFLFALNPFSRDRLPQPPSLNGGSRARARDDSRNRGALGSHPLRAFFPVVWP